MSSARMRLTKILQKQAAQSRHAPKPALVQAAQHRKWDIVRGDRVQVVGKHAEQGKQGTVKKVIRAQDRVLVSGLNLGVRHVKGNAERGIVGRMITTERAIPYHLLSLVDPVTNQPTKITYQVLDDGTKVRVSKKSQAVIPRPEILRFRKRPVNSHVSDRDTTAEDAWRVTYTGSTPPRYNYT